MIDYVLFIKVGKEHPVHFLGIVLAGVKGKVRDRPRFAFPDDRGHLDDLGTGTEDYTDLDNVEVR